MPAERRNSALTVRLPGPLRKRLEALVASGRHGTRNAAHAAALARGLDALLTVPAEAAPASTPASKARPERLERLFFRTDTETARRLRAHAEKHGVASTSEAITALLVQALDQEEGVRGVPATKADEVTEGLRSLGALVERMGPGVLGMLHLLAHWAVRSGGVKVTEDELLAEVLAVGESQWQQLLEEAEETPEESADNPPRTH